MKVPGRDASRFQMLQRQHELPRALDRLRHSFRCSLCTHPALPCHETPTDAAFHVPECIVRPSRNADSAAVREGAHLCGYGTVCLHSNRQAGQGSE